MRKLYILLFVALVVLVTLRYSTLNLQIPVSEKAVAEPLLAPAKITDSIYSKDVGFSYEVSGDSLLRLYLPKEAQKNPKKEVKTNYFSFKKISQQWLKQQSNTPDSVVSVSNVYFDELNLATIQNPRQKIRWKFENCVIKKLICQQNIGQKVDVLNSFEFRDVSIQFAGFQNVIFKDSLRFIDTDIKEAVFENSTFAVFDFERPSTFQVVSLLAKKPQNMTEARGRYDFKFRNCIFGESPIMGFTFFETLTLDDCVFMKHVAFESQEPYPKQTLDTVLFNYRDIYYNKVGLQNEILRPFCEQRRTRCGGKLSKKAIDNCLKDSYLDHFGAIVTAAKQRLDSLKTLVQYNHYEGYSFENSIFTNGVTFRGLTLNNCLFRDTEFKGDIDISDDVMFSTNQKGKTAKDIFKDCSFYNAKLILNLHPESTIDSLSIRPEYVSGLSFHLKHAANDFDEGHISEPDFYRIRLFFDKSKRKLSSYSGAAEYDKGSAIDDALKRLDHEFLRYEIRYHWLNNHTFTWLTLALPELFVRSGYGGIGRFLAWSVGFIVLFSLIYYIGYRHKIVLSQLGQPGYILADKTKREEREKELLEEMKNEYWFSFGKNTGHKIQNLGACFMCSANLFINPKFPLRYFSEGNNPMSLLVLLFTEYLIGVSMLAMAIYYISKQYEFITKLIGMAL